MQKWFQSFWKPHRYRIILETRSPTISHRQQNLFAKTGEPEGEGRVRIKNESDQVSYPRLSCLNCQLWLMVVLVFKMHFLGFITTKVSERRHRD